MHAQGTPTGPKESYAESPLQLSLKNSLSAPSFSTVSNSGTGKSDNSDSYTYSSREDSFISIKFENNGRASWDNIASPRLSWEILNFPCNHNLNKEAKAGKSVVEHAKPHGILRWQKRIGHLFQLVRWKRSNKANLCRVGSKVEGVKGRKHWIRALTERRTME